MNPTVLITDCYMGPADLERSVLEPAGWSVVHGSSRTEQDVVAAVRSNLPEPLDLRAASLAEGRLAGVAYVWWEEPARADDPLLHDPRVVVTPHVAWLSPGSVPRLRLSAARRLLDVLVAREAAPTSAGGTS